MMKACLQPAYYLLLATAHHDEGRGLSRQPPLEPLVLWVVGEERVALPHLVVDVLRGEWSGVSGQG